MTPWATRWGRRALVILVAAGIAITVRSPELGHDETSTPSAPRLAPLHLGMKDINGADVTLESFKGRVILVNFWATWCGPCRAEIPDLISVQTSYPQDVAVVGVVVLDRFGENVRHFASEFDINYPVLDATARPDVEEAFGPMWGLPTTFVIGRDGRIARKFSGIGSKEQFEQEVRKLL